MGDSSTTAGKTVCVAYKGNKRTTIWKRVVGGRWARVRGGVRGRQARGLEGGAGGGDVVGRRSAGHGRRGGGEAG